MRTIIIAILSAAFLFAQEFPEFTNGMKAANAAETALQKMEKRTGPQAARAAERLGGVYEQMIPFWRQRNAANAVKTSEEGKAAAAALANAAYAGDADKADAAFQTVVGTCKSCHAALREKTADGKYRIKTESSDAK